MAGQPFGIATWDIPTVYDNSGKYTLTSTYQPGDTFNIGDTTVIYAIIDESGNMAGAQFVVQVTGRKVSSYFTFRDVRQDEKI